MKKSAVIWAVIIVIVTVFIFYNNFNQINNPEDYDWESDGIQLMQHETEGFYACFGCNVSDEGPAMCIDPAPVMIFVEETEERYCDDNFEVVEN